MAGSRLPADVGEDLEGSQSEVDEIDEPDEGESSPGDEGDEADLGADVVDEEEEPEGHVAPRRGGGGATTPRNLRARAQEAERQNASLLARIEQLERSRQQAPPPDPRQAQLEREQEEARLAIMTPAEIGEYYYQKAQRETRQQMLQMQLATFDGQDRATYNSLKATLPAATRLERRVEELLANERAMGNYRYGRLDILKHQIGEEILAKRQAALPGQQRRGARRVAQQTVRPGRVGGDVARTGRGERDQDAADEESMRNLRVGDIR